MAEFDVAHFKFLRLCYRSQGSNAKGYACHVVTNGGHHVWVFGTLIILFGKIPVLSFCNFRFQSSMSAMSIYLYSKSTNAPVRPPE